MQLRAVLELAREHGVRVLVPMGTLPEDVAAVKRMLHTPEFGEAYTFSPKAWSLDRNASGATVDIRLKRLRVAHDDAPDVPFSCAASLRSGQTTLPSSSSVG